MSALFQKRQARCNLKCRSEKFNSHQEEVASGFPIEPPRVSQTMEESGVESQGHPYKRASHSGPLVHQRAWSKGGTNLDDAPKALNGADLSISGPVSTRSMLSEDSRDKSGSLQPVAPKLVAKFPGSFKETSASINGQDQMHHIQGPGSSHQNEGPSISTKDAVIVSTLYSSPQPPAPRAPARACKTENKGSHLHFKLLTMTFCKELSASVFRHYCSCNPHCAKRLLIILEDSTSERPKIITESIYKLRHNCNKLHRCSLCFN